MKRLSNKFKLKYEISNCNEKNNSLRIIGLNSGTSGDGLDAALVEFHKQKKPKILCSKTYSYSSKIKNSIIKAGEPEFNDGRKWMKLDAELGGIFGNYTADFLSMLKKKKLKADLIASHGQTIRHLPSSFGQSLSLQIGDPSYIAKLSRLPVIFDFRKSDLAAGGQGAPLSSVLHKKLFQSKNYFRAVVNIGGISNITVLPPVGAKAKPFAADCGPGNMAIDEAMRVLFKKPFDSGGRVAFKGNISKSIVNQIMKMRFFGSPPPKSAGREDFGRKFVGRMISQSSRLSKYNIIASISEITARGIADFILKFAPGINQIFLCGGGAKNQFIGSRLKFHLKDIDQYSIAELGYDPDYIEAMLWAYLGFCFWNNIRVDARLFTGAKETYIPGRLCLP